MGAGLDDPTALEDDDPVGVAHARETVRDEDRRHAPGELDEAIEEGDLGAHIERRRGLVEDQDPRSALEREQGARDGDPLPLPTRQVRAVAVLARQRRVQPARQDIKRREGARLACRLADPLPVRRELDRTPADVLGRRQLVPVEVLEDDADPPSPVVDNERPHVEPIHGQPAGRRFVEPREELDHRGLPGSVEADDRGALAGRQGEFQPIEHRPIRARIVEADRLEPDVVPRQAERADVARRRHRRRRRWIVVRRHPALERGDAVVGDHPELGLRVGLGKVRAEAEGGEAGLECQRELGERHDPGRRGSPERGERDAGDGQPDRRVGQVRLEVDAPSLRPDGHEPAQRRLAEAVADPARQAEDPDLLGSRGLHRDRPQVRGLASFGDVASEDAPVGTQPTAVAGPEQHRGDHQGPGRRPREHDADDRREREQLAVAGNEREDRRAGVAGRPEHEFERARGLRQLAQQALILERGDARGPQRRGDQAVVDLPVNPP